MAAQYTLGLGALGDVLINVDFDGPGKEGAPRLQVILHHGVAGELLTIELNGLIHLIFNHLEELSSIIGIPEQPYLRVTKSAVHGQGILHSRSEERGRVR